jgi:hypothetical protein
MKGFGSREFQLVLLRRMADYQPGLVSAALRQLDASPAEFRAVHQRWQAMLRSRGFPCDVRRYILTLGCPDDERVLEVGDAECVLRSWALPHLWPELRWRVITDRDGLVLDERLIRSPDSPVPTITGLPALTPWSCVIDDVVTRHPNVRHINPLIPSRWVVTITDHGAQQGSHQLVATFVWGLLQASELQ